MIGYKEECGSRVYRVYNETTKQVLITRDVVFDETTIMKHTSQAEQGTAGLIEGQG